MKVEAVETRTVVLRPDKPIGSALGQLHAFGCILVTVRAGGISGENIIFTLNNRRTAVLRTMIEEMADLVIGRDAGHIAGFWARAWRDINFLGHKGVPVVGISALDGALWDVFGKASGQPLYRLLGGASDRVPAYHSGGLWLDRTTDQLCAEALRFKEQGFGAMKMRLGLGYETDLARVRAVREAIGPDVKLMADANQGMTEASAIRLGRGLEEFGLTWFEEPLPAWDLDGLARVAAALDTPIASGETDYSRYAFRRMLELRSADVLMPDLQRVGGVTEFMRVSHMAEAFDIPVSSHLFPEQSLAVLGALSNAMFLEYMPWFSELYRENLEFEGGDALVPERPGFGFTFDEDRIRHLERQDGA
ncbi:mandelate racemase/muconate lactonizing enzyme family protein [Enterovirga rhinocerotis]|uniref:L-alanine-DL-glutamate epimerase-like enolase superfamily enzyme n=1 Tax=Enterovirga rhinocerotis TaxID=1339210 RepID=A0A4R7C7D9_9HYPH|nr:mandelate racemase/muconate lactonizing enzyme family protein [Enterovirga rhinocerotis]TDR93165.1 L-alanine-DL-glutamate epimerase-like enolase superfamily enzyme [Enterovirga rhinocerotis]